MIIYNIIKHVTLSITLAIGALATQQWARLFLYDDLPIFMVES